MNTGANHRKIADFSVRLIRTMIGKGSLCERRFAIIEPPTPQSCDWCDESAVLAFREYGTVGERACAEHAAILAPYLICARVAARRRRQNRRYRRVGHAENSPFRLTAAYARGAVEMSRLKLAEMIIARRARHIADTAAGPAFRFTSR